MQAVEWAGWLSELHESEVEAFQAYLKLGNWAFDEDSVEDFRERYSGYHHSDDDFAYELCNEIYELPEHEGFHPANYIDWERVARDLMMDYYKEDGHYFRA